MPIRRSTKKAQPEKAETESKKTTKTTAKGSVEAVKGEEMVNRPGAWKHAALSSVWPACVTWRRALSCLMPQKTWKRWLMLWPR